MLKSVAVSLALVVAVGCASTPLSSSSQNGGTSAQAPVTTSLKNAPDYILLSAPSQIREWDFSNAVGVRGFHLRGTMTNRGFMPAGEVQGNGKFCADRKDWFSLADLSVHKASDGKTPTAPYLLGCATSNGFVPASRAIVTQ